MHFFTFTRSKERSRLVSLHKNVITPREQIISKQDVVNMCRKSAERQKNIRWSITESMVHYIMYVNAARLHVLLIRWNRRMYTEMHNRRSIASSQYFACQVRFIKLLSMYIAVADCANASCDQVHVAPPFCINNIQLCFCMLHAQLRLFPLAAVCMGIADAAYLCFASFCERAGDRAPEIEFASSAGAHMNKLRWAKWKHCGTALSRRSLLYNIDWLHMIQCDWFSRNCFLMNDQHDMGLQLFHSCI